MLCISLRVYFYSHLFILSALGCHRVAEITKGGEGKASALGAPPVGGGAAGSSSSTCGLHHAHWNRKSACSVFEKSD